LAVDGCVTPLIPDAINAEQTQGAVEKVESLDILINNVGVALFDDLAIVPRSNGTSPSISLARMA